MHAHVFWKSGRAVLGLYVTVETWIHAAEAALGPAGRCCWQQTTGGHTQHQTATKSSTCMTHWLEECTCVQHTYTILGQSWCCGGAMRWQARGHPRTV